jgi:hypothetical protein
MIKTVELDGVTAFVAGPLEQWPGVTASLGTGLSGRITLVAGRCLGLGEFIVIWPNGTTLKMVRGRLRLKNNRKSLAVGAKIKAGRELAGLTPADQDELSRLMPPECLGKQVIVLGDWP